MTEQPRAASPGVTGSAPGGSAPTGPADNPAAERIVIRDKRKIDPAGGAPVTAGDGHPDETSGVESVSRAGADGAAPPDHGSSGADTPGTAGPGAPVEQGGTGDGESDGGDGRLDGDGEPGDAQPHLATPVADEEIAQVLAAETPSGPDAPVVDEPAEPSEPTPTEGRGPFGPELEALRAELDERTRDLQRVSAEYANYRKRVDRDRGLMADQATGTVLVALLPILDDLDRAREHGDLVGPFGTVAEQLVSALGKFGLTPFGEPGDRFDPTRHEAVAHQTSAEVTESTCVNVMRRGYLHGDRLLRPALVGVADPE